MKNNMHRAMTLTLFMLLGTSTSWSAVSNSSDAILGDRSISSLSLSSSRPNGETLDDIFVDTFESCRGMSGNDIIECQAEQLPTYRERLEDAGASSSTVERKVKKVYGKLHSRIKSMVESKDADKREQGDAIISMLFADSATSSYVYRKLESLEKIHERKDRKYSREEDILTAAEDFKDECSAADNPLEIRRAIGRMKMENRRLFNDILRKSRCREKEQSFRMDAFNSNPFGMNPGTQCMGDFCLPNSGLGAQNMFTHNRCMNTGFGSSMIGINPMFRPNPIGCGMGLMGGQFASPYRSPMHGGHPLFRPPMYGGNPYMGAGHPGMGRPPIAMPYNTGFGRNMYGSGMIQSPMMANNMMPMQPRMTQPMPMMNNPLGSMRAGMTPSSLGGIPSAR